MVLAPCSSPRGPGNYPTQVGDGFGPQAQPNVKSVLYVASRMGHLRARTGRGSYKGIGGGCSVSAPKTAGPFSRLSYICPSTLPPPRPRLVSGKPSFEFLSLLLLPQLQSLAIHLLSHYHSTLADDLVTMVGVPGKYKGCNTCRARRVKASSDETCLICCQLANVRCSVITSGRCVVNA